MFYYALCKGSTDDIKEMKGGGGGKTYFFIKA
jgi:hypothetical protein